MQSAAAQAITAVKLDTIDVTRSRNGKVLK